MVPNLSSSDLLLIHTLTYHLLCIQEQFEVQFLAQGHFAMWTGGADLAITGPPALSGKHGSSLIFAILKLLSTFHIFGRLQNPILL